MPLLYPFPTFYVFQPRLFIILLFYPVEHFQTIFNVFTIVDPFRLFYVFLAHFQKLVINFRSLFLHSHVFHPSFLKNDCLLLILFWNCLTLFSLLRPLKLPFESCTLHFLIQDSGQRELSDDVITIGVVWGGVQKVPYPF